MPLSTVLGLTVPMQTAYDAVIQAISGFAALKGDSAPDGEQLGM